MRVRYSPRSCYSKITYSESHVTVVETVVLNLRGASFK
jgi:hypothetical protein